MKNNLLVILLIFISITTVFAQNSTSNVGQKRVKVFFDFDKDFPNKKAMTTLNDWIAMNKNVELISISSYCDSVDDNFYNKELAKRRINSVLEIIQRQLISINKDLKINVIGEDFKQFKMQEQNRYVSFEYVEKTIPTKVSINVPKVSSETNVKEEQTLEEKIETERTSLAEKFKKAKVGDRIAIYNIHFQFNSENLVPSSEPLVEELLFIMEQNPDLSIKIHGHICCNPNPLDTKLSFRRAIKIFNYLRNGGINLNRLAYNGVGSNDPIYKIPEKNEYQKIINRRVEIEIVNK